VFLADVEQAVSVDPSNYYKEGPIKDAILLSVPAGKTGFIEVVAEKVKS
jgi:hypothetical protein